MEHRVATETASWYPRLLLMTLLAIGAYSAIRPMVSYRALELGAGPLELGFIASSYAVLALLTAIPVGRWVDGIGESRFLLVGPVVLALSAIAMAMADSLLLVGVAHAIFGFGHVLLMVAGQTLIANRSSAHERQQRFGMYGVMSSIGQGLGPLLGGLVAGGSVLPGDGGGGSAEVLILAAIPMSVAGLAAASLPRGNRRPNPVQAAEGAGLTRVHDSFTRSASILRRPGMPQIMGASVAVILCLDLLIAYLPAYGVANGISVAQVGMLFSVRAIFSLASRVALGSLIRHLGAIRVLVGNLALAGIGFALLPWIDGLALMVVTMAVIGFGVGTGQPMTIAMTANMAPPDRRGESIGLRLTGNRIAQLTVPWAVGAVAASVGLAVVFLFLASTLGVAATALILRPPPREGPD